MDFRDQFGFLVLALRQPRALAALLALLSPGLAGYAVSGGLRPLMPASHDEEFVTLAFNGLDLESPTAPSPIRAVAPGVLASGTAALPQRYSPRP